MARESQRNIEYDVGISVISLLKYWAAPMSEPGNSPSMERRVLIFQGRSHLVIMIDIFSRTRMLHHSVRRIASMAADLNPSNSLNNFTALISQKYEHAYSTNCPLYFVTNVGNKHLFFTDSTARYIHHFGIQVLPWPFHHLILPVFNTMCTVTPIQAYERRDRKG